MMRENSLEHFTQLHELRLVKIETFQLLYSSLRGQFLHFLHTKKKQMGKGGENKRLHYRFFSSLSALSMALFSNWRSCQRCCLSFNSKRLRSPASFLLSRVIHTKRK